MPLRINAKPAIANRARLTTCLKSYFYIIMGIIKIRTTLVVTCSVYGCNIFMYLDILGCKYRAPHFHTKVLDTNL